ncbi:MAG: hypothetical protein GXP63_01215 [DPANN group archaeon]|nr:hypothetical protein [DPANN group archaeon]
MRQHGCPALSGKEEQEMSRARTRESKKAHEPLTRTVSKRALLVLERQIMAINPRE